MNNREHTIRIAVRKFGPFESALRKIEAAWRLETGVELHLEAVPMELPALHEAILRDNGLKNGDWDIAHVCTDWIAEAALKEAVEDLSPYLQQHPPEDYPHGWPDSLLELQRSGERILGLPFHDGPECLIYRKDLFGDPAFREAYRQRYAAELCPPRTWEEFRQVARYFHRPQEGLYGAVLAGYPDGHNAVFDFCLQLWSRGGSLVNNGGAINIDTSAARDGLEFYRSLMTDTSALHPGSARFESVGAGAAFAAGEAAMTINWFGFAAACEQDVRSAVKGKTGVAAVPAGMPDSDDSRDNKVLPDNGVSLNVYWLYCIGAGSRHKTLAYDFIRFATSRANDKLLSLEGGIGCRLSTWNDLDVRALVPYYDQLEALHKNARTLPLTAEWPEIAGIIDAMVQEAIGSDVPADALLKKAQRRINRLK